MYDVWCDDILGGPYLGAAWGNGLPYMRIKRELRLEISFQGISHGVFRNQHQTPVPAMYNITIFENFLVRPYFGGYPRGRITIYGLVKWFPHELFEPPTRNVFVGTQ